MIKKVELNDVPGRATSWNTQIEADLKSFMESDWPACEVGTEKYKSVNSARNAYDKAIKRLNMKVDALTRNGRLFLVKV